MAIKKQVPHINKIEGMTSFMKDGYEFIQNKSSEYKADVFETSFLGQKIVCMHGNDAAKVFYNRELFQRGGAIPKRIQRTLTGEKAIHTLDGEEHIHRKLFFMSLMTPIHEKELVNLVSERLESSIIKWMNSKEIVLLDEMANILCWSVCQWAGVPLSDSEIESRAEDLLSMVDGFGAIGPRHWKGSRTRNKTENWIREIIEDLRQDKIKTKKESALYQIAFYRDVDGKLLSPQMAAIEVINAIRPVIAISIYITFAALSLYKYPECKNKLLTNDSNYYEMFTQEIRRYYPFAPFLGAKVKRDFIWKQYRFKKGMLVLLDIYGNNHDPRIWESPDEFKPERFKDWEDDLFTFIPQGGGDPTKGHRCSGERITIEILKTTVDFLLNRIEYDVPQQDLSYSLLRIPTFPESGFIITNIREKQGH